MTAAGILRALAFSVALVILAALGLYQISQLSSVRARLDGLDAGVAELSSTWSSLPASTLETMTSLLESLQAALPFARTSESDPVSDSFVLFDFASDSVSPGGVDAITEFVERERSREGGIRIEGFADTIGSAAANLQLSLRRAKAVERELLARGIDPARIDHVSGEGEATPPVRTGDEVREPSNRAVVIRVERGPESM